MNMIPDSKPPKFCTLCGSPSIKNRLFAAGEVHEDGKSWDHYVSVCKRCKSKRDVWMQRSTRAQA